MMSWLVENWVLVVIAFCAVVAVIQYIRSFAELPVDEQIGKVKEWLLYAVTLAERELGEGTGKIKLRYVYDMFLNRFAWLAEVIDFEEFSTYVDEALKEMNHLLYTNTAMATFVSGPYYVMEKGDEEEVEDDTEDAENVGSTDNNACDSDGTVSDEAE